MTEAEKIAGFVLTSLEYLIENVDPEDGVGFDYDGSDPEEAAALAMEYTLVASEHRHILKNKKELYEETLRIVETEYGKRWL